VSRKEDRSGKLGLTAEAGLFWDKPEEDSSQKEKHRLLQAWEFIGLYGLFSGGHLKGRLQEFIVDMGVFRMAGCIA
jgi:hypothetical protein